MKKDEIEINGIKYVPKGTEQKEGFTFAKPKGNKPYVIIRTYSAGIHAGYLDSHKGQEVKLINSRRLWYWEGAFTLNKVAMYGVDIPANCKFSCEVPEIILTQTIEIIKCSEKARQIIQDIPVYQGSYEK